MRWGYAAGASSVAAVLGWASAGLLLAPAQLPPASASAPRVAASDREILPSPSCEGESPLLSELAALQIELEAARAADVLSEGQEHAEIGAPQEWSDDVPDAFGEEAVEAYLSSLVAKIPGAVLVGMDCAEYPCAAVLAFAGEDAYQGYEAFNASKGEGLYASSGGTSTMYMDDETGQIEMFSWSLTFPAGLPRDQDDVLQRRLQFRSKDLTEAYKPDLEKLREASP